VAKPLTNGIRKITLYYDGLVKKATVVDTGRLRSSITNRIQPNMGEVGTNVKYASFIEYGTEKMEARHMERGSKKLGQGMFDYALGLLRTWLDRGEHGIHKDIDARFE